MYIQNIALIKGNMQGRVRSLQSWKELEKMGKTTIHYKLKEPIKLFVYVEH